MVLNENLPNVNNRKPFKRSVLPSNSLSNNNFTSRNKYKKKTTRRKLQFIFKFFITVIGFIIGCFLLFTLIDRTKNIDSFMPFFPADSNTLVKPFSKSYDLSGIEKKLKDKNIEIESIKVESTNVNVKLKNGTTVLFVSDKDIDWQISSLQSILLRLTIDNKKPLKIDFRYQKPIVNF